MFNKILIVFAAIAAMGLGFWAATTLKSTDTESATGIPPRDFHGSLLATPRKIAIPALRKDDGTVFTNADMQGHWRLVFFGYTHCPDICPTTLNTLAQTKKQSPEDFPEVLFVSVDPQRDTVDILSEYIQYFDPSFKAVTGDKKLIQALTLQMSVVYMRMPGAKDDENYLMDHSSAILVLNTDGKLVAYINPPHTPENILKALAVIQK